VSVEDFFLAGLGFEIAGAWLVSRGLLQSVRQLAITSGKTLWSLEQSRAPYVVEDRVRAEIGLAALGIGFFLQVLGYALILGRSKVEYGSKAVLIGVGLAVGSALIVLLIEAAIRPRLRDRILKHMARFHFQSGAFLEKPNAGMLRSLGEDTGRLALGGEDDVAYCARVFGVEVDPNS
jgi:hypothetical protein